MPKFNAEQLTETDDLDEVEYEDFCWQQKRFKTNEIECFRSVDNCKSDAQKRYHLEINGRNENDGPMQAGRIFSYVMDDKFAPRDDEMGHSGNINFMRNVESVDDGELLTGGGGFFMLATIHFFCIFFLK